MHKEKVVSWTIILSSLLLSLGSFFFYLSRGYILIYADAFAHLNIARQVVDSITPGPIQLGTVWLPLQHIAMLPFIWNTYLWHSGIAGSIGSMCAYIVTVFFTYKTARLLTHSMLAGVVAAAIIGLNPNYLYMQAIPMSESLMLATISSFLYFLLQWQKTNEIVYLILSAICVCLSTLTRYEGWFLTVFGIFYVFLISLRRKSYRHAEGLTILFSVVAFLGIGLWFLYNYIIIGNPFFFLNGQFSAKAQQDMLYIAGSLPTKHNLLITLQTYVWDLLDVAGIILVTVASISLLVYLIKKPTKVSLLYLLVAFGPPAVIIFTLYVGITVIAIPQVPIHNTYGNMFNVRYGLMSLPFIALAGSLFARYKAIAIVIFGLIITQALFFYRFDYVLTLNDSLKGVSAFHINASSEKLAQTLANNCKNTETLMMIASHDETVIASNLPIKRFIYEGNYRYWQSALKNPTPLVGCIVMGTHDSAQDPVRNALIHTKALQKNYLVILDTDTDLVYKKKNL